MLAWRADEKIHALTDERCSPLTVQLTAGQAGDNPMLWPLLDEHRGATRTAAVQSA